MKSIISDPPILTLCMIVKNEERHLERCLASAQPYVDEIVVVDTGSEDETVTIAQKYGAIIEYFPWCDDFAAARNYAIAAAQGKWILVLDADEELVVQDPAFFDQLNRISDALVFCCNIEDAYSAQTVSQLWTTRLFCNTPTIRYVGSYHEQLHFQNRPLTWEELTYADGIKIRHYGYSAAELARKHEERTQMLERLLATEGLDLGWLWTLSGKYSREGELEKVEQCHAKALDYLFPLLLEESKPQDYRYVPTWLYALGMQALQANDLETALLICQQGLVWSPDYPPINYCAGLVTQALGFPLGATAYFQKCLKFYEQDNYYKAEPFKSHLMTTFPACDLGLAYVELKQWDKAQQALELSLSFAPDYVPAKEHLDQVKQHLGVSSQKNIEIL